MKHVQDRAGMAGLAGEGRQGRPDEDKRMGVAFGRHRHPLVNVNVDVVKRSNTFTVFRHSHSCAFAYVHHIVSYPNVRIILGCGRATFVSRKSRVPVDHDA